MTAGTTAAEFSNAEEDLMQAVAALWGEQDRLAELLMGTIDLIDYAQEADRPINVANLRTAAAKQLRASFAERTRVLAPFGLGDGEVK